MQFTSFTVYTQCYFYLSIAKINHAQRKKVIFLFKNMCFLTISIRLCLGTEQLFLSWIGLGSWAGRWWVAVLKPIKMVLLWSVILGTGSKCRHVWSVICQGKKMLVAADEQALRFVQQVDRATPSFSFVSKFSWQSDIQICLCSFII